MPSVCVGCFKTQNLQGFQRNSKFRLTLRLFVEPDYLFGLFLRFFWLFVAPGNFSREIKQRDYFVFLLIIWDDYFKKTTILAPCKEQPYSNPQLVKSAIPTDEHTQKDEILALTRTVSKRLEWNFTTPHKQKYSEKTLFCHHSDSKEQN